MQEKTDQERIEFLEKEIDKQREIIVDLTKVCRSSEFIKHIVAGIQKEVQDLVPRVFFLEREFRAREANEAVINVKPDYIENVCKEETKKLEEQVELMRESMKESIMSDARLKYRMDQLEEKTGVVKSHEAIESLSRRTNVVKKLVDEMAVREGNLTNRVIELEEIIKGYREQKVGERIGMITVLSKRLTGHDDDIRHFRQRLSVHHDRLLKLEESNKDTVKVLSDVKGETQELAYDAVSQCLEQLVGNINNLKYIIDGKEVP